PYTHITLETFQIMILQLFLLLPQLSFSARLPRYHELVHKHDHNESMHAFRRSFQLLSKKYKDHNQPKIVGLICSLLQINHDTHKIVGLLKLFYPFTPTPCTIASIIVVSSFVFFTSCTRTI